MAAPTSHKAADPQALLPLLLGELNELAVVLLDTNGRFISWHPGVFRQFGYVEQEWLGQSVDILSLAEEGERADAKAELVTAAAEGRTSAKRWLVAKSGRQILVEGVTIALRSNSGQLLGFGKLLRDITEDKDAEDSLTALGRALDQSTVLVRRWNGPIDHWTAGCERLYGWSAQEAVGKSVHQLLDAKYPASLEEIHAQLLRDGTWKGEIENARRDGSRVFVSTHWVLLGDPSDEPITVIETHTDITVRLQIQHELESANNRLRTMALELERSNQELEEFARIASHDLSAPITSTRWLADLLATRHADKLDATGKSIVKQITQGLQRMSDLVDAVLAHAKVGRGAIGSAESVSAGDSIHIALENLRRHVELSGARVVYGSLPSVNVERQALSQLFQNLLSNAIKYRRPDITPEIEISARWNDGVWEFAVHDNGIGIESDWYERIFQPMQRRHGLEIAGSGIGLATCKKIVTRAGGRIWVESVVNEGSIFLFTLPGSAPNS